MRRCDWSSDLAREPRKPGKPAADAIDIAAGVRIEQRRRGIGMSRFALAQALGVSFQQIRKYERGGSRLAASTLVRTAAALQTSVSMLVAE